MRTPTPPQSVARPQVATHQSSSPNDLVASRSRSSRWTRHFWGFTRVSLLAGAVSTAALTARVHSAKASFGRALDQILLSSERSGNPTVRSLVATDHSSILLNGMRIKVQSQQDELRSTELKRGFLGECPSAAFLSGSIFGSESSGPSSAATPEGEPAGLLNFTGMCLSRAGVPLGSPLELVQGAARGLFDPSELSAKILFGRELPASAGPRSQSLRFELTLGSLLGAFPIAGDAPGSDPTFVERPPGRRLLSVVLENGASHGQPSSPMEKLFMYEVSGPAETVLRDYVRTVHRSNIGLRPVSQGPSARTFADTDGYFSAIAVGGSGGTLLTIARL